MTTVPNDEYQNEALRQAFVPGDLGPYQPRQDYKPQIGNPAEQAGGGGGTGGGAPDYQSVFMKAARETAGTPQERYKALQESLSGQGFQFQTNTPGQRRGRVKAPDGNVYDTWLNEANDAAFLGDGKGVTGDFGWLHRGHESQSDGGGWSFGGGGAPGPSPMLGGSGVDPALLGGGGFFDQLMAQLASQGGPNAALRSAFGQ